MISLFNLILIYNFFNDSLTFLYYFLLYMYIELYNLIYIIIISIISAIFYFLYIRNNYSEIYLIKKCFLKFIIVHGISISTSLFSFLFHNHYGLMNDEYEEFFILSSIYLLLYSVVFYIEYYFILKKYNLYHEISETTIA